MVVSAPSVTLPLRGVIFFTFEIIGKTFVVTRSGSLSFKRAERYEVKFIEADARDNFWGGLRVLGRAPPQ